MESKNNQTKFWEQFKCPRGVEGKKVAKLMNNSHSDLSDWGLNKVKLNPNFVILDIGCGGGKTIEKLARKTPQGRVYGIDHSPDMVDYSREINKELIDQNRVSIVQSSVDKTKFSDNFFDLITAIETYYFWPSLSDAFQEISRVLKAKGKLLLINEMIKDGVYETKNAEVIAKTKVKLVSLEEIKEMLKNSGFMQIKIFTKKGSPWNAVVAQKQ